MVRTKQTAAHSSSSGKAPRKQAPVKKLLKKHSKYAPGGDGVKKPHRFRPGTVAIREIKKQQKSVSLCFPKTPFRRLIREIAQDYKSDLRFTKESFLAIQTAAEAELVRLNQKLCILTIHRKHQTIEPTDLKNLKMIEDTISYGA